jgi:hypothetical protein
MTVKERRWFWLLVAALAVYTVKSIFVGADIDESYGVTLGYRLVQGDRLMWDMWEPHQTSAIFTALFIRLILIFTGGSLNYMTVLLRVCFFLVQLGITVYLYRCFQECLPFLGRWECMLFAMIYYITTPKCIYVPEYSNLHMWFSTVFILFLMQYFCKGSLNYGKMRYLLLSGAMLACDVLSYPGMALLYPFCAGYILLKSETGKSRVREFAVFTLPCILGAAGLLGYIFSYMSLQDFMTVLPCIMGDGSHQTSAVDKLSSWGGGMGEILLMTAGCGLVAAAASYIAGGVRRKKGREDRDKLADWLFWWFVVQTVFQTLYWLDTDYNSGYPQLAYMAVPLFGWWCARKCESRGKTGLCMIGLALLNFAGLNLFSNWRPASLTVYLVAGLLGGLLCWREYFWEKQSDAGLRLIHIICVIFILSEVFGRCLLMIGGEEDSSMTFQVRGISREGVRGGILTSYMNSYRYNNNYELFPEIVPEGSMVLYLGPSQFYYMLGDCRIASPTTISTPEYDENLELYYELHPERFPDVVVMESCYGDVSYFGEDDYIFKWIEEEFQPVEVTDYPYVRVYRR